MLLVVFNNLMLVLIAAQNGKHPTFASPGWFLCCGIFVLLKKPLFNKTQDLFPPSFVFITTASRKSKTKPHSTFISLSSFIFSTNYYSKVYPLRSWKYYVTILTDFIVLCVCMFGSVCVVGVFSTTSILWCENQKCTKYLKSGCRITQCNIHIKIAAGSLS